MQQQESIQQQEKQQENIYKEQKYMKLLQNKRILFFDILLIVGAVFLDQYSKVLVRNFLSNQPQELIPGVLELRYLENGGAAFGMLQGKKIIFLIIAAIVMAAAIFIMWKLPAESKYNKLNITLSFILAGAVGNAIDRIAKSTVTDFVYFKLINFPIFNVADIYITIGTIVLAIMMLFIYKEEDFAFLTLKHQKAERKDK